jgi:hypothetical protein
MSDFSRRSLGVVFGMLMGLSYGLVSQTINRIALPDIPLNSPEPGLVGTILLSILAGGLIGLCAAWTEETISGVVLSALAGAILTTAGAVYFARYTAGGSESVAGIFVLMVITFLPRAVLFLPVAGLLRWVLNAWKNELRDVRFSTRRLALGLLLLVAAGAGAGTFSLYPQDARYALQKTDDLIQAGMPAQSREDLPEALRPVDGFLQGAQGSYRLSLSENPDLLPVQRPIAAYGVQEYAVFVVFENQFRFGCAFTPPNPEPACGEY